MRKVNKIVIHCTATKEGQNVSPATIKKWHLNRGFFGHWLSLYYWYRGEN